MCNSFTSALLLLSLSLSPCRFLQVRPACVEDERLLVGIVTFLNAYFKQVHTEFVSDAEDRDLRWILELLINQVHIICIFWTNMKVKPSALGHFFLPKIWIQSKNEDLNSTRSQMLCDVRTLSLLHFGR